MCFAPQWRALFRHLNFQRGPKMVYFVLVDLNSTRASRHKGVQFFISHLARWLRTRRFSEPTFRPSRATNHWKNTVVRDFPTCIFFFWLFLFCHLLSSALLFYSSLLSDPFHLCFSSVHIVGSLTSKLPSILHLPINDGLWMFMVNGGCRPTFTSLGGTSVGRIRIFFGI